MNNSSVPTGFGLMPIMLPTKEYVIALSHPYHILLPDYITFPYSPVKVVGGGVNNFLAAILLCSCFAWQSNKATFSLSSIKKQKMRTQKESKLRVIEHKNPS